MPTNKYHSVALDLESYLALERWSSEECRSVSGQLRFLVKQHGAAYFVPQAEAQPLEPSPQLPEPLLEPSIKVPVSTNNLAGWEVRPQRTFRLRQQVTQRLIMMEAMAEYAEPLVNSELAALTGTAIDKTTKHTSGMFSQGQLCRRPSQNAEFQDRFEYMLHPRTFRLLKARDKTLASIRDKTLASLAAQQEDV